MAKVRESTKNTYPTNSQNIAYIPGPTCGRATPVNPVTATAYPHNAHASHGVRARPCMSKKHATKIIVCALVSQSCKWVLDPPLPDPFTQQNVGKC